MKIAILGPVCKDYIKVDNETKAQIGSIVYYTGVALKNLGVQVTAFATFNEKDNDWIVKHFEGVQVRHISDDRTLEVQHKLSRANPDVRINKIKVCAKGVIKPDSKLISELDNFDVIILAPLLDTNIPFELVEKLKHKKIVYGNFGIFTACENGNWVAKYPEKLIQILPYLQYVFLDVNEAVFVSDKKDIYEIASFFHKKGLKNLILTEGSKGSHVFSGEKYYKIPAFSPNKLIDPTGAGDNYVAGFIKALDLFDDPEKQGRFAAMVATISLEKRGTFDLATKDVLERLKI
ncbi:MAG TPA: PfkB family carbohydrate kinase [Candidatus Moranbacteria bacterium]|nr:PfkB family carbohydrate kinase [Candidatus Moranbacteria bacterium]